MSSGKIKACKSSESLKVHPDRFTNESVLLKLVNSVKVGPKMIDVSKNFLVMEYLEGEKFIDWIETLKGIGVVKKLKSTIKSVLEDCYRLDQIGLDHGEIYL